MCELPVIYGMPWVRVIECLFFPELVCILWFSFTYMGTKQGKRDASTLLLLKYLRSSVTTEFESSSKLYVVFLLCLILCFVSKFFQPFQLSIFWKFLAASGVPSTLRWCESAVHSARGTPVPLKYPQTVLGCGAALVSQRINGLHWLSCREVIAFLEKVGFVQCVSQTNPVLPLCSRVLT